MSTASGRASFLRESKGKGIDTRSWIFPKRSPADDLADTLVPAADCLSEAIAVGIARAGPIQGAFETKRGKGTC